MWTKEYDTATFAGMAFDVLTTEEAGGHRVSVQEIPYSDQASVEVMGAKNNGWNLDAVFIGENGLNNAKAFVAYLSSHPIGILEHPDLGKLDAVFVSHKLKLSTKRGMVAVSLEFISQGKPIDIPLFQIWKLDIPKLEQSIFAKFLKDVKEATNLDFIDDALQFITEFTGDLQQIADLLSMPSELLTQFHQQIDRVISSANQILNAPQQFIDHLQALQATLTNEFSGKNTDSATGLALTSDERITRLRINSISKTNSSFAQQATILVLADRLDKVLPQELGENNTADSVKAADELASIINLIELQIADITTATDEDSVELYQQFRQLRDLLAEEKAIHTARIGQLQTAYLATNQPLIKLQYQYGSNVSQLNTIKHPLFVKGELKHG